MSATTTPEALVRQLSEQGIDPRQFARDLSDLLVWLDAGDHHPDEIAQRYAMNPTDVDLALYRYQQRRGRRIQAGAH